MHKQYSDSADIAELKIYCLIFRSTYRGRSFEVRKVRKPKYLSWLYRIFIGNKRIATNTKSEQQEQQQLSNS